ncbi:DUF4055 domain-containing protein [Cardiobacteriaceae bacterium TAE3-ERU3]|nr:DUF4055 domain-containing protein [Cardiobacteriaceae bacterium TAE3-ERU3]
MTDVSSKSSVVSEMHTRNAVIETLLGGTEAMREAGQTYLPKWPLENDDAYKARVNVSTLYPALKETVASMVGRVFYSDMSPKGIPDGIDLQDIDAVGNKLEIFCADWFRDALAYGVSYCVVDYQRGDGVETMADAKALGLRPHAIHVPVSSVLGWRSQRINGNEVCTQFRYIESVVEDEGEFGEKTTQQVIVLEPGIRKIYRKGDQGYALHDEVTTSIDVVPVVALYTERSGFFTGRPPLLELAHLNVKHWQSQSDQDNILHCARVPMLARFGVEDSEKLQIGGSTIDMPSGTDIRYIEHTGASIGAGAESLKKLEEDMRTAGAKLLVKSSNSFTDSQAKDEQTREVSTLKSYANRLEDAVGQMLYLFALWLGKKEGGTVEISGNMDIDYNPSVTMQMLRDMYTDGIISAETVFNEAKKREIIGSDVEWEAEQAKMDGMNAEFDS